MIIKLTDITINSLKFQHPQITHWDALLPGFGVRVGSRTKTFVIVTGKARKRTTIGRYPAMSLKAAKTTARLKLDSPHAIPQESSSVSTAVTKYLASVAIKDRTHRDYKRLLNKHLVPVIGNRRVEDVTTRDILSITDKLLNTPSECRHAHTAMQTFFNWCVPRYLPQSPMTGLKCPTKPNHRTRTLSEAEIKAVWHAAGQLGVYGHVVRLCLLLAARKGEIPGKRTLTDTTITFHDTKNGTDHTLPITPYMHKLLSKVQYTNGWSKNFARLTKLSGVSGFTLHDLRRTTSTKLHALKVDPFIVERILNHSLPKLQKIYNQHNFTESMREPLERHEKWLLNLVEKA